MNIREITKKAVKYVVPTLVVSYCLAGLPQLFGERIKDQQTLNKVIAEEKVKLGLENIEISGKIKKQMKFLGIVPSQGCAYKGSSNHWLPTGEHVYRPSYVIEIGEGIGATRGAVRHELTHIANGDSDEGRGYKDKRYWLYREHIANISGGIEINLGSGKHSKK